MWNFLQTQISHRRQTNLENTKNEFEDKPNQKTQKTNLWCRDQQTEATLMPRSSNLSHSSAKNAKPSAKKVIFGFGFLLRFQNCYFGFGFLLHFWDRYFKGITVLSFGGLEEKSGMAVEGKKKKGRRRRRWREEKGGGKKKGAGTRVS